MSKIYSQLAENWHAFVRHFPRRTFYVNAVAKMMGPIDTWEIGSEILSGEVAVFFVLASDVRLRRRVNKFIQCYQSRAKSRLNMPDL